MIAGFKKRTEKDITLLRGDRPRSTKVEQLGRDY